MSAQSYFHSSQCLQSHTENWRPFGGAHKSKREGAKRLVPYDPRLSGSPVAAASMVTRSGPRARPHCVAGPTLGRAHPPTERGHVATVGPARVVARARRVRHGRLQVRAPDTDARELTLGRENCGNSRST
ncbi:unnamed protein product [Prunus armeniaca]|uniref:Uncharacterized protein n=1 Tax=Prunus armeniaca TaxID=36596 RepID=A0A6J5Y4I9_PRUAR|nr:unnamed protein product [Prunus armeniaca]